jgi:hypothetical protein
LIAKFVEDMADRASVVGSETYGTGRKKRAREELRTAVESMVETTDAVLKRGLDVIPSRRCDFLRLCCVVTEQSWTRDLISHAALSYIPRLAEEFPDRVVIELLNAGAELDLLIGDNVQRRLLALWYGEGLSLDDVRLLVKFQKDLCVDYGGVSSLVDFLQITESNPKSREQLLALLRFAASLPEADRPLFVTALFNASGTSNRTHRQIFAALHRSLPVLAQIAQRFPSLPMHSIVAATANTAAAMSDCEQSSLEHCLLWLLQREAESYSRHGKVVDTYFATAGIIAGNLCDGDFAMFNRLATVSIAKCVSFDYEVIVPGLPLLVHFPHIRQCVRRAFLQAPQTCFELFRALWLASRAGVMMLRPLKDIEDNAGSTVTACNQECCAFTRELDGETAELWCRYQYCQQLLGQ